MSIESEEDWIGLREVGRIVQITLDALQHEAKAGVTTGELDRLAATIFQTHRAKSAPSMVYGFPGTVLISVNDEVVHGVPGPRRLRSGDVVKLDVTAEKNGYVADAARTVVLGEASGLKRRLRACAEAAFGAAMRVARPGNRVNEMGGAVFREVRRHGFSIVPELAGHGVGGTIHEPPQVPNFCVSSQRDLLGEGLVLAVEPIICCGSGRVLLDQDGWTIRTQDGSLAAHYENTIVITSRGPVSITGPAAWFQSAKERGILG